MSGVFFRDASTEPAIPTQFVFICWGTDCLAVGCVNGEDTHITDSCGDHTRLRIDCFIAKRRAHVAQLRLRENRHAVVRLLPVITRTVTGRLQTEYRKQFVRAFGLLQTDNVRLRLLEPGKQPILSSAQRINVPRDYLHSVRCEKYPFKFTPGEPAPASHQSLLTDPIPRPAPV
jgi:hypothetical protein